MRFHVTSHIQHLICEIIYAISYFIFNVIRDLLQQCLQPLLVPLSSPRKVSLNGIRGVGELGRREGWNEREMGRKGGRGRE